MKQQPKDYDPTDEERAQLISVLISAREQAGLNQLQLSERLGKTKTFATKVENGYQEITFWQVVAWAKATGTPAREFMLHAIR